MTAGNESTQCHEQESKNNVFDEPGCSLVNLINQTRDAKKEEKKLLSPGSRKDSARDMD